MYILNYSSKINILGKQDIFKFVAEEDLDSLKELDDRAKYIKVRVKIFNERKRLRMKRSKKIEELSTP